MVPEGPSSGKSPGPSRSDCLDIPIVALRLLNTTHQEKHLRRGLRFRVPRTKGPDPKEAWPKTMRTMDFPVRALDIYRLRRTA